MKMKKLIKKMAETIVRNWNEGNALMLKTAGRVIL